MRIWGDMRVALSVFFCTLALGSLLYAAGQPMGKDARKDSAKDAAASPVVNLTDSESKRVQGELRFHQNCGRCHAAPEKFPPRMMATVVRHMRVRATITDADMRLVLFYMTQ